MAKKTLLKPKQRLKLPPNKVNVNKKVYSRKKKLEDYEWDKTTWVKIPSIK